MRYYLIAIISILTFLSSCGADKQVEDVQSCDSSLLSEPSTVPEIVELRNSMLEFRASLSEDILSEGTTCLESERLYLWHNTPANSRGERDGITFGDLDAEQLGKFRSLLQLFLSADGYKKVNDITVLSEGWLNNVKSEVWNTDFYSIDMFGTPESAGSWGVQLDGHHCVVNFLVDGDNVSIVPAFLGGEPAKGEYKGEAFDIFRDERDMALTLYNSLNPDEVASAVTTSSTRALQVGPAERNGNPDPYIGAYDYSPFEKGLKYADMSEEAKSYLMLLMKEYVYNLNQNFADSWWDDINEQIDETYFVWIDNVDKPTLTSQFYYRIYNKYLWVEFNTEDVTGANQNNMEDWNHIHSITRIPNNPATGNGGDYGRFAALQLNKGVQTMYDHYSMAAHHASNKLKLDYVTVGNDHYHGAHGHTH